MRIIGTIPHPIVKISVFKMDERFAVKLEMGMLEQTYKFRATDELNSIEDIDKIMDEQFIDLCITRFKNMSEDISAAVSRAL